MENYSLFTIHFIEAWLLYLVMQALFINAVKLGSAGDTTTMPDGSVKDSEMILYPLAKELLKKEPVKMIYTGWQLENILNSLKSKLPSYSITLNNDHLVVAGDVGRFMQDATSLTLNPGQRSFQYNLLGNGELEVFAMIEDYYYSKWLRKPIIQCIVCMSSFWGLFTFLIPMLIVMHFNLLVLPAYIVNTVLLSAVNKLVFKLL